MIVTTWNNGEFCNDGNGYGIRFSKVNLPFLKQLGCTELLLQFGETGEEVECKINATFWTTCPEVRSKMIGKYLIKNNMDKWKKGEPFKLPLLHLGGNRFILLENTAKELETWAGRSVFSYLGNVATGVRISFGKSSAVEITKNQFDQLLKVFRSKRINIGTSRDTAEKGSLGDWLQENVTPTATASYVGAILLHEGYAKKEGSEIIFY